jgi:hypothetical protein
MESPGQEEMEKLVADLQKIIPFKETTEVGDLVLLVAKEPQMLLYALVTDLERDRSRKDEWWHVTMQLLSVPLQSVTWTLRLEQFTGQEIFTMGGEQRFVQAVQLDQPLLEPKTPPQQDKKNGLRLVR